MPKFAMSKITIGKGRCIIKTLTSIFLQVFWFYHFPFSFVIAFPSLFHHTFILVIKPLYTTQSEVYRICNYLFMYLFCQLGSLFPCGMVGIYCSINENHGLYFISSFGIFTLAPNAFVFHWAKYEENKFLLLVVVGWLIFFGKYSSSRLFLG